MGQYAEILLLDHHLEVAAQARRDRTGPDPGSRHLHRHHQAYWDAARRKHGDAAGTRVLIEVLLAHRTLPAAALDAYDQLLSGNSA